MSNGKRRYQIWLESENKTPIDVFLLSKDDVFNQPAEASYPTDDPVIFESQPSADFVSTTPLTPMKQPATPMSPPGQVDTDYYLNNMYQSEGISDFYAEGMVMIYLTFCKSFLSH
jgi:hypothetical protein